MLGRKLGAGLSLSAGRALPVVAGEIFPFGAVGEPYAGFLPVLQAGSVGGTWAGSNIPSNLTVSSSTGALTGTPGTAATSSFSLTYTDPAGTASNTLSQSIEITPANICTDPSDLTGAWWTLRGLTTGAADAFRGVTGTKVTETAATSKHGHYLSTGSFVSGGVYGQAVIAKQAGWGANDRVLYMLSTGDAGYGSYVEASFDLKAGTLKSSNHVGSWSLSGTPEIVDLGGGWYFCRMLYDVGTTALTMSDVRVFETRLWAGTENFAGDTGKSLHIAWADFYRAA